MKINELKQIISEYVDLEVKLKFDFGNYDVAEINLPDGGTISVGIEPKYRKFEGLMFFNIWESKLRLSKSNIYNGKFNYFGENKEEMLRLMLNELKEKLKQNSKNR